MTTPVWNMISFALLALVATMTFSLAPVPVQAAGQSVLRGDHASKSTLPKGCRSCHRGMRFLISDEAPCLKCHGSQGARDAEVSKGYLRSVGSLDLGDIEAELQKPYSHPVLSVSRVHNRKEALPEEVVDALRHSECFDCHNAHEATRERPLGGVAGKRVGNFITEIEKEYELCYRCHAESANLPLRSTNKHAEFKTTNPSFHPVEGEGVSSFVISLKAPYTARKERPGDVSIISCSDCHGSDDPNGPSGPHGSRFEGLLSQHYEMEDARPESDYAYALCYKCHERSSILGNESFPYHSLHILGGGPSASPGASCISCHDAHGSTVNPYLIRFDENVVSPNAEGKLEYRAQGVAARRGECFLSCHGVEHNPLSY